jgi:cytochrome c556
MAPRNGNPVLMRGAKTLRLPAASQHRLSDSIRAAKKLLLPTVIFFALVTHVQAEGPDIIETRMAGQDLLEGDFDGIRAVVEAKGDVEPLEEPAKAMARWIKQFPAQFPVGSEHGHDTRALSAIWSHATEFRKASDDMALASDRLAQLAKAGDAEGVAAQVKVVGSTCRACHQTYRAR